MESNSCIQNRSEPFWFGQVWRKVYLPSCRATILRQDSTGPDLLLLWYSSWRTLALCSAPVKPQCSNLLDLSPSEASIINMCFQGHPFLMIHGGGAWGSTNLCFGEPAAQLPVVTMVKDTQDNWKILMFWQICFNPTTQILYHYLSFSSDTSFSSFSIYLSTGIAK